MKTKLYFGRHAVLCGDDYVAIPVQQWKKPFEAHFNKRVTYAMFILT